MRTVEKVAFVGALLRVHLQCKQIIKFELVQGLWTVWYIRDSDTPFKDCYFHIVTDGEFIPEENQYSQTLLVINKAFHLFIREI